MDAVLTLQLFSAGCEKRICASAYAGVKSLDRDDHPFELPTWDSVAQPAAQRTPISTDYFGQSRRSHVCLFGHRPRAAEAARHQAPGPASRPGDDRT